MKAKGEETYQRILAAAMQSFARLGDKNTTFQSIADIAGVSQPLVAKYFKSREAVLPAVVDKFLHDARVVTAQAVDRAHSPKEKLKEYLRVSIKMFRDKPEIFKIYLLLHYYAGFSETYKEKNSEIKRVAVERVTKIIEEGISQKLFKKCNAKLTAKIIHSSLVGVVLGITTEHPSFTDLQLQKTLEELVFKYLET
jgi:AcrR family transcriptional regulator